MMDEATVPGLNGAVEAESCAVSACRQATLGVELYGMATRWMDAYEILLLVATF